MSGTYEMQNCKTLIDRAVHLHKDWDAVCPAEMWNIIEQSLKGENIEAVLDGLSPGVQTYLVDWGEHYLKIDADTSDTRKRMVAWYQRKTNGPTAARTES